MAGIYLFSCKARHNNYDIIYNDIDAKYKCDITADALTIPLQKYNFIIASPPCNWWSKANPYYKTSPYALETKELLPKTIKKLAQLKVPFLIENVKNKKRMAENGIFNLIAEKELYFQFVGRHIYISNIICNLECPQQQDFIYGGKRINKDGYNQGGTNVYNVVEKWLKYIHEEKNAVTSL